jgi:hypothetical protein
MDNKLAHLESEIARLRMVVAIDSAMLLSVLRLTSADQLARASIDFLEVCEGLSTKALFSELGDHSLQASQQRRDWWIGLIAELVADAAVTPPASTTPLVPQTPGPG